MVPVLALTLLLGPSSDATGLRFRDSAAERGLVFRHQTGPRPLATLVETTGSGVCVLDLEGDGDDDVYLVSGGPRPGSSAPREPSRLFRNDGGRFVDVTERAGVGGRGFGIGCSAADLDGDGDPDLLVTNFGPDELFLNDGSGRFREVGVAAGLADPRLTSSAAAADHDGDGDLDLFVGAYADVDARSQVCEGPGGLQLLCAPIVHSPIPSRLLRNEGPGIDGIPRFRDVTAELGVNDAGGRLLGVLFEDLDGDHDADLYLANDMTRNVLQLNDGGTFRDVTLRGGVGLSESGAPEAGMGVDAGDLDGDGRPELVVTNFAMEANTLYRSLGRARWADESRSSGLGAGSFRSLGFGVLFLDLDLDGDLDLFVANGHVDDQVELHEDRAVHAQPDQVFETRLVEGRIRLEERTSTAFDGIPHGVGRGSAWLDLEGDGDLDLIVNDNGGAARLYENVTQRRGAHWLGIRLEQQGANPAALGATVELTTPDGREQYRRIRTACSFASSSPPRAHFGLGTSSSAELAVTWPDGERQLVGSLESGRVHLVRRTAKKVEASP